MLTYLLVGLVILGLVYLIATRRRPAPQPEAVAAPDRPALGSVIIRLPADRNRYGALYLRGVDGSVIDGAFDAIGRAADALAQRAGNPERVPTRPYGDTPLGTYRLKRIEPAPKTPPLLGSHGPHGRIILVPVAGEAVLAEAAGRLEIAIEGGRLGPNDTLRATEGGIRVHDQTIWILLEAFRARPRATCQILPLEEADPALDDWDDGGDIVIFDSPAWDSAWPDPTLPVSGYAPDVGPALTGTLAAEAAGVAVGVAAAEVASGEFLSGGYDP